MKIERYSIGNTIKFRLRNPQSEKEAREKLFEAAQEYIRTSNRTCCLGEIYALGKVSYGLNIKEF